MPAQVTAAGIRDGDPAVLHALVDRRGSAVLAYCEQACAPGAALDAAAEAFARFRESVLVTERPAALDPEAALLGATRRAAAARAPRPAVEPTGLGRLLGGADAEATLARVPELVAARAEGLLSDEDDQTLDRLLDASPVARAIEEDFAAAEQAYRTAARRPLPDPVAEQLVTRMATLGAPGDGDAPQVAEAGSAPLGDEGVEAVRANFPGDMAAEPQHTPVEGPTEEWSLPADDAGDEALEAEVAAAQIRTDAEDPAHLQSASGAVEPLAGLDEDDEDRFVHPEEEDEEDGAREPIPPPLVPAATAAAGPPAAAPRAGTGLPRLPAQRPRMPSRAALAPAAAVVAIAAIGAMAAAGVFGGNEPSPPVDTGIVPPRALQAVPEGEAASVVDDLRSAAEEARRRRLADQRQGFASPPLQSPSAPRPRAATDEEPAADDATPAPPTGAADGDPGAATGDGGPGTGDATEDAGEGTVGDGGTSAEDATGGGTSSP